MQFFVLITMLLGLHGGRSFYNIQFERVDGAMLNTASYQGKKVIIAIVDAETPDLDQLRFLDSLQRNSINLEVIGVLTEDFGKKARRKDVKDSIVNFKLIITRPLKVRKSKAEQHPLLSWLTSEKENLHFDIDVRSAGQLFLVSGKGTLFSVLIKETPRHVINKVITQAFPE